MCMLTLINWLHDPKACVLEKMRSEMKSCKLAGFISCAHERATHDDVVLSIVARCTEIIIHGVNAMTMR